MAPKRRKPGRPRSPVKERRRNILTIRLTDVDHARVARMAKHHGCSMSEEIEGQLVDQRIAESLSKGAFNLGELAAFSDYAEAVRSLVARAGGDKERWVSYARHVPFPRSRNAEERQRDDELSMPFIRRQMVEEEEFWSDPKARPYIPLVSEEEERMRELSQKPTEEKSK